MADTINKDYCCMSDGAYHYGERNTKMLLCYKAAKFTIMADAMKKVLLFYEQQCLSLWQM